MPVARREGIGIDVSVVDDATLSAAAGDGVTGDGGAER
jgi:hypothetical protein